jgi:hypothetical protein
MNAARLLTYLLTIGSPVLALGGALAGMRPSPPRPVYAVATVQAQLQRDPHAWVGRIALVRGAVIPCRTALPDWLL